MPTHTHTLLTPRQQRTRLENARILKRLIFTYLKNDYDTLRLCSQVSRDLREMAAPSLFRFVSLSSAQRAKSFFELCHQFGYSKTGLTNPLLYIQSLFVTSYEEDAAGMVPLPRYSAATVPHSWIEAEPTLPPLLLAVANSSKNLYEFRFCTQRRLRWMSRGNKLQDALMLIISSPLVLELNIGGIDGFPLELVAVAMKHLKQLHLGDIEGTIVPAQSFEFSANGSSSFGPAARESPLQELTFFGTGPSVIASLTTCLSRSASKTRFGRIQRLEFTDIGFEEVPAAIELMRHLSEGGSKPADLAMSLSPCIDGRRPDEMTHRAQGLNYACALPLGIFKQLCTLDLEFESMFVGAAERYTVPIFLAQLLSAVVTPTAWARSEAPQLHGLKVFISLKTGVRPHNLLLGEEAWPSVDAALSRLGGLETVNICINYVTSSCPVPRLGCPSAEGPRGGRVSPMEEVEQRLKSHFKYLNDPSRLAVDFQFRLVPSPPDTDDSDVYDD